MRMKGITAALSKSPKMRGAGELHRDKEMALNLAAYVEQTLGPVAPGGATPVQETLSSLQSKLNTIAHRPADSKEPPVEFTPEEQQQLIPLMTAVKQGFDAVKAAEKFISNEDVETIVRVITLYPAHAQIVGILGLNEANSRDRVSRALKVYAYLDPPRYTQIISDLATARNHLKQDWNTLGEIFKRTDKFGIERTAITEALEYDDWHNRIMGLIEERTGGPGALNRMHRIGTFSGLVSLSNTVETYRRRNAPRATTMAHINRALRDVFMHPGVAGRLLTQEALQPNAPSESKRAYDAVAAVKQGLQNTIQDEAALTASLSSRLGTRPIWANRHDPAVAEVLAREWCESTSRDALNVASEGGTRGGFWAGLWDFLTSLIGVAYTRSDINRVAQRIRAIP